MTQQGSESANKHISAAFFGKLLRDRWTQLILYFFVFFFTGSVPLMMYATKLKSRFEQDLPKFDPIKDIAELLSEVPTVYTVIAGIVALFCAILMFSYLNSRVSVNFYHSLPIRRTKLFFMHYFGGIFIFAAAVVANLLIAFCILAANGFFEAKLAAMLVRIALSAAVYFIVIYSSTVLVGMTTGLAPVQFLLTLFAMAILPLLYLAWILYNYEFVTNFWVDYYLTYDKIKWLSPIFFVGSGEVLGTGKVIGAFAFSLVCVIISVVLYHFRLSERSGNPIVFGGFAQFVKYAVMLTAALYAAILFYEIGGWFYFGAVSGTVLSWMIANAIINKTGRAMFKGVCGMAIFAVCLLALISVPRFDLFGVVSRLPETGSVKSIEARFGGDERGFVFNEKSNISALRQIYDAADLTSESQTDFVPQARTWRNVLIDTDIYSLSMPRSGGMLELVFKDKFGFRYARSIYVSDKYALDRQLEIIADSEEFRRQYTAYANNTSKRLFRISFPFNRIEDGVAVTTLGDGRISGFNDYGEGAPYSNASALSAIRADAAKVSYAYFNTPIVGGVNLSGDGSYSGSYSFPINLKSGELFEYLCEQDLIKSADYARDFADAVTRIVIYDFELDRTLDITDREQTDALIGVIGSQYSNYSRVDNGITAFFAVPEKRYAVLVTYTGREEYVSYDYDELTHLETSKTLTSDTGEYTEQYMFYKWQVPEWLDSAFETSSTPNGSADE